MRGKDLLLAGASGGGPVLAWSMTSQSGRRLGRHISNEATVIEFDYWGTRKMLIVPDAKYRDAFTMGAYGINMPELANFSDVTMYLAGRVVDAKTALPALTDKALQTVLASYKSDKTSRENCNIWMTKTSHTDSQGTRGVPAVQHCRNLNIDGLGAGYFDLPNAYELAVIYAESDNIDALDQTAAANPGKMLGKGGTKGRLYFLRSLSDVALSSTEYGSENVIGVSSIGQVCFPVKYRDFSVVPARAI